MNGYFFIDQNDIGVHFHKNGEFSFGQYYYGKLNGRGMYFYNDGSIF